MHMTSEKALVPKFNTMQHIFLMFYMQYLWVRKCFVDMSQELLRCPSVEREEVKKTQEHPLCGICFTHHLTEKLCFSFNISQQPLERTPDPASRTPLSLPHLLETLVCQHYSQMANQRYHDLSSNNYKGPCSCEYMSH